MSEVTLVATTGRPTGSAPSRRLRAEGKVPAVLYGHGMDSLSVSVDRRELRHALTGPAGVNALINLSVDGVIHPTIVKSLQRDPIKRNVGHVDFIVVRLDEVIEISRAPSTWRARPRPCRPTAAWSTPRSTPSPSAPRRRTCPAPSSTTSRTCRWATWSAPASSTMPEGVELVDDPEMAIVTALAAQVEKVEEPEEGEEEAEGEAAEGAEAAGCRGRTVRGRRLGRVTERRGTPADLLVMGLGNPGQEYSRSRHNVGAEVVEELARRHGGRLKKARQQRALTAEVSCGRARLALAVPTTYVNLSGDAASSLIRRYGIDDLEHLVVVHDELDLEPGVVRIKQGGGLAGHNGLRSITQHLKTQDYLRVRIGVGKPPSKERGADHVLRRIPKRERELLDVAVQVAADAVEAIATNGLAAAMNDINGR